MTASQTGFGFQPDDDQRLILDHVRQFCREQIAPKAAEYDRSGEFPWPQLKGLADLGLLGASVPEEWGGSGLSSVTYALCLEEISAADASVGVIVSVQNGLPTGMLLQHGTEEQKEKYLRPLATGQHIGAFCLTESGAGSDAAALKLKAEPDGRRLDSQRLQSLDHQPGPGADVPGDGPHGRRGGGRRELLCH